MYKRNKPCFIFSSYYKYLTVAFKKVLNVYKYIWGDLFGYKHTSKYLPFVFGRTKKFILVWNNLSMSKL